MAHWCISFKELSFPCCIVADSDDPKDPAHILNLVKDFLTDNEAYSLHSIQSYYGNCPSEPELNNPVLRQFTEKNLLCMLMLENTHGLMSKPHPSEKDLDTARELISKAEAMGIEARRLDIVKAQTSLDFAQSDFDCDKYR